MLRARRPSAAWLIAGAAACLSVGLLLGRCLTGTEAVLWRDASGSAARSGPGGNTTPSFRGIVQQVGPAVVSVRAILEPESTSIGVATADASAASDGTPIAESTIAGGGETLGGSRQGSGFLVHTDGLVVSSRHVVVDAAAIEVLLPTHGRRRAELVGEDAATDLALLRILNPPADLPSLPLGGSEELMAGDWIVAIGNPLGFEQTVTAGVVSFVGRHLTQSDLGVTADFLQLSAPLHPGSSGCPVVDLHGRVVGVTTQIARKAPGISFAVPSRSVQWSLQAMNRRPDGHVRRGYLGIEFASRGGFGDDGQPRPGAVIVDVRPGEPADRAGLRAGDVVLRVDGAPLHDARQLHERIVCSHPGAQLALTLLREGLVQDPIVAVLGEMGQKGAADPAN